MAEFLEVMKQYSRMCKSYGDDCTGCGIWAKDLRADFCFCNKETCSEEAIKAVEIIVKQWAAEHPEPVYPTWEEWLQSVGVMESSEGLLRRIQGQLLIDGIPVYSVPSSKVLQPMDADIAQKLGIEPKKDN